MQTNKRWMKWVLKSAEAEAQAVNMPWDRRTVRATYAPESAETQVLRASA